MELVSIYSRLLFPYIVSLVLLATFFTVQNTVAKAEEIHQNYDTFLDPYFGVTLAEPSDWYVEGDNPWLHTDITPWHLPLIPIKELQPTAVDILLEGKKTQVYDFQSNDEAAIVRMSVEKTPFGMSLDGYVQLVVQRISSNNENVRVDEISKTTLDGNPAIRLVITFGEPAYQARTTQILSLYGSLAYTFQYDSSVESYHENLATAEHIFDSVKISPPASRAQILLMPLVGLGIAIGGVIGIKARRKDSFTSRFLRETKRLFPSSFGIEVLCVASAEIGGFLALWHYGFNTFGITMAYIMAYALAGFTTFASILGRSAHTNNENEIVCGCSEIAEHGHDSKIGFKAGIKQAFVNFAIGLTIMTKLHKKANAGRIIKASLIVLLSAESGCVIAAATIDVVLYQYSAFLSIPAALLAGTLTVASMAAFRLAKIKSLPNKVSGS
jgi:hypothetical protein